MCIDNGRELQKLLRRAKLLGLATSLDLSMPDMSGHSGRVCWPELLRHTLPYVDFFLPSFDEVRLMLDGEIPPDVKGDGEISAGLMSFLAEWALDAGSAVAGIKAGRHGLYIRSAGKDRLACVKGIEFSSLDDWTDRDAWAPCFEASVVGTTGSGDATIAGFILGLVNAMSFDEVLLAGCAVGACSVEAADSVSGIGSWNGILERIQAGWPRVSVLEDSYGSSVND
jgi:sugar/nucleoside kinase (ribokinase family)